MWASHRSFGTDSKVVKAGYQSALVLLFVFASGVVVAHGFRGVAYGQLCGPSPDGRVYLHEQRLGAKPMGLTGIYDDYMGEKEGIYHGFEFSKGEDNIYFSEYFCGYQTDVLYSGRLTAYFPDRQQAKAYFNFLVEPSQYYVMDQTVDLRYAPRKDIPQ